MLTRELLYAGNRDAALTHEQLLKTFNLCVRKTRWNIQLLADCPKSAAWAADGNYFNFKEGFYEIGNWTSSFFTGMALLAWWETEDEYFLNQVLRLAPPCREKVFTHFMDTHHDLGFLYSLYSVALYKLTGDKGHREVDYLNFDEACHGVQKHGQSGENGHTSWGDYFLMEALSRELDQGETFW